MFFKEGGIEREKDVLQRREGESEKETEKKRQSETREIETCFTKKRGKEVKKERRKER